MCSVCGMNPCHPSCPNAPEPVPVYECCRCGYGILEGDIINIMQVTQFYLSGMMKVWILSKSLTGTDHIFT